MENKKFKLKLEDIASLNPKIIALALITKTQDPILEEYKLCKRNIAQ